MHQYFGYAILAVYLQRHIARLTVDFQYSDIAPSGSGCDLEAAINPLAGFGTGGGASCRSLWLPPQNDSHSLTNLPVNNTMTGTRACARYSHTVATRFLAVFMRLSNIHWVTVVEQTASRYRKVESQHVKRLRSVTANNTHAFKVRRAVVGGLFSLVTAFRWISLARQTYHDQLALS